MSTLNASGSSQALNYHINDYAAGEGTAGSSDKALDSSPTHLAEWFKSGWQNEAYGTFSGYNVDGETFPKSALINTYKLSYLGEAVYEWTGLSWDPWVWMGNHNYEEQFGSMLSGNDTIIGSNVNDVIAGFTGDDTLKGGKGDDSLSGDGGIDTAFYQAARGEYRLDNTYTNSNGTSILSGYKVTPLTNNATVLDGTDQVSATVEYLHFTDGILRLSDQSFSPASQSSSLYSYNGHTYRLTSTAMTWQQAETEAVSLGGHLVAINDSAENSWVKSTFVPLLTSSPLGDQGSGWIGYTDNGHEGQWTWVDGSNSTFTNWNAGEPNNQGAFGPEHVAHLGAGWNDLSGNESLFGIIEIPTGDSIAPTITTFSPTDEATNVAVASNIVVTFNEAIQRGTGNIVLKTSSGATIATYDAATSSNLTVSGSTLTLNPTSDLTAGTAYKVEFAAGSLKDLAGNAFAGTTSYNFTTASESVLPSGTSQAKVYLGLNDAFTLSDSGITLYGNTGIDVVTLSNAASAIVLDQNVDHIRLAQDVGNYTFKQTGNKINLYDAAGTTLLVSAPVQSDTDGTLLGFANGTASTKLTAGVMTMGGATVSTTTPAALSPSLGANPAIASTPSTAKVYLGINDHFTVSTRGTTLYGNTGIDQVTLGAGVSAVALDQNVDEVILPGSASSYAFKQTGNKINVYDVSGTTLLTSLPVQSDADGTLLTFSEGTVSAKLSAGVMSLGVATVSGTAITVLQPFGNNTVSVTTSGSSSAAGGDKSFTLALGNYTHTITDFTAGDQLNFPEGGAPSVDNNSFSDGEVTLNYANGGQVLTVRLTGLSTTTDGLLNSLADFATVFGVGTIV